MTAWFHISFSLGEKFSYEVALFQKCACHERRAMAIRGPAMLAEIPAVDAGEGRDNSPPNTGVTNV
ncbi:hypothetical protein ACVWZW_004696 [Bradyrhizobium sp. F1.13.4]